MPAPNDLTSEEEAAFVEHGVQPAGPGSEPVIENEGDVQQQGGLPEGVAPPEPVTPPAPAATTTEVSRHREDGTFKTQEEFERDIAAAQAAPAPAAPANDQQAPPGYVPHQALHAERQRAAAAIRTAQLATTRMNALLTARGEQAPPAMPDLQEDPVGYIQSLEQRLEAFERTNREEAQFRQIDNALDQDEELFSQSVPDYQQASDHYVRSRAQELLQFNTPQDAQRIMVQEARAIANQAWQRGQSAAQVVYGLAQARGYQPGNTAANPQLAPIPPRPAVSAQQQQRVTPQAQIAATRAAQASSRSLSGGSGAPGTEQLNAEAVLGMSDEEFESYLGLGKKGADQRFAAIG